MKIHQVIHEEIHQVIVGLLVCWFQNQEVDKDKDERTDEDEGQ